MSKIVSISFASGQPYEKYLAWNAFTAKHIGKADEVYSYTEKDIPSSYREEHIDIFAYKRGAGLWLWKPYFVSRTLEQMEDDDWLIYADAGVFFVKKIKKLIKYAEQHHKDSLFFGLPLINRQFCKRECYELLGITDKGENQAVGTYFLLKKTQKTVAMISEWKQWCENVELLSPKRTHKEIEEFPDFFSHREDQSLLSLLLIKHGVSLNKDCSNFGIFPYDYCYKEFEYRPIDTSDETYGVVLISHRRIHPLRFYVTFQIKRFLKNLNLKYTEKEVLENRPSFANNITKPE